MKEDRCGVCGGDGSKCKVRSREFDRKMNKIGNTKIMLLPKGARNIQIILSSEVSTKVFTKQSKQFNSLNSHCIDNISCNSNF